MNHLSAALSSLLIATACLAAEPQNVPVAKLGEEFQLIGKLHWPLGKLIEVKGVVAEGPDKGYEGGLNLRAQIIHGRPTQEDIQIVIRPYFTKWGEKAVTGGHALPQLEIGATYEMEGYETGGYVGVPGQAWDAGGVVLQTTGNYFQTKFVVIKAKKIEPVIYTPWMFRGERALLEGKAVTREGNAFMAGDGWSVKVIANAPWPKDVEGKFIETLGLYNPAPKRMDADLVDGQWRLVNLEDQLGRKVELRGWARSLNDVWWFHYRGTDVYVENMATLPGWTPENHWRPMIIQGRLEKATLPRLDQISLKADRDLQEYFIVRDANWKPLPALLGTERVMPSTRPSRAGEKG